MKVNKIFHFVNLFFKNFKREPEFWAVLKSPTGKDPRKTTGSRGPG